MSICDEFAVFSFVFEMKEWATRIRSIYDLMSLQSSNLNLKKTVCRVQCAAKAGCFNIRCKVQDLWGMRGPVIVTGYGVAGYHANRNAQGAVNLIWNNKCVFFVLVRIETSKSKGLWVDTQLGSLLSTIFLLSFYMFLYF